MEERLVFNKSKRDAELEITMLKETVTKKDILIKGEAKKLKDISDMCM